jgi:hypothetical protein
MFKRWKIGCGVVLAAALFALGQPSAEAQAPGSGSAEIAALEKQLEVLKQMTTEVEQRLKAARESEKRPEPGKGMPGMMGRGFGKGAPGFGKGPGGMGAPGFGKMDEKRMAEMKERMEKMQKMMEERMKGDRGRPETKEKDKGKEKGRPEGQRGPRGPEKEKGRDREMEEQRAIRERLERLMREVEELRRNLKR